MNEHKLDESVIPEGYYCVEFSDEVGDDGQPIKRTCPYWSYEEARPEHECGYCYYLGEGDWDINDRTEWTDVKTGQVCAGGFSLLWDQCKECDVNVEEKDES